MISERYAVGGSTKALGARTGRWRTATPVWQRWTTRPAVAGRERLVEALGRSVLVQLMLAMTFIAAALLLYLAQASQVSVLEFSLADLQTQHTQLTAQNASLRATATALQSLKRVDRDATNRLHMTKPDISTTIWVWPVVPRVPAVRSASADVQDAQERSQPLAWLRRLAMLVESSL